MQQIWTQLTQFWTQFETNYVQRFDLTIQSLIALWTQLTQFVPDLIRARVRRLIKLCHLCHLCPFSFYSNTYIGHSLKKLCPNYVQTLFAWVFGHAGHQISQQSGDAKLAGLSCFTFPASCERNIRSKTSADYGLDDRLPVDGADQWQPGLSDSLGGAGMTVQSVPLLRGSSWGTFSTGVERRGVLLGLGVEIGISFPAFVGRIRDGVIIHG